MGHPDIPIILLAAGASSRMRGGDKLLEEVDGQPLLRRQALMARSVTSGEVIVALPPKPHARYEVLQDLGVRCLPVPQAQEGMGASIRTATQGLPKGTKCAMYLLADMPELTENDLKKVLQIIDLKSNTLVWRGATQTGTPGHPIVFHADFFPDLKALKGDSGARDVVASAGAHVQLIPLPGNHARLDLDTPEDWAAWRAGKST